MIHCLKQSVKNSPDMPPGLKIYGVSSESDSFVGSNAMEVRFKWAVPLGSST